MAFGANDEIIGGTAFGKDDEIVEAPKKPAGVVEGVTNVVMQGLGSVPFLGPSLQGLFGERETANKEALSDAINAGDVFLSSQAASLARPFSEKLSDNTLKLLQQRLDKRKQWANPNDEQTSTAAKLGGLALTAPLQIPRMLGYDSASTGKSLLDAGESLGTAVGGVAVDTVGNMAGAAVPLAKPLRNLGPTGQLLSGAALNAGQDTLARAAISGMTDTEQAKRQFAPSAESALLAAGAGAMFQAPSLLGGGPAPTKTIPKNEELSPKELRRLIRAEQSKVSSEGPVYAGKDGVASKTLPTKVESTAEVVALAKKQQAEALAKEAQEAAYPHGEQIPLFGEEMLPHETNPVGQLTRQPEQVPLELDFNTPVQKEAVSTETWYTGSPEPLTKTRTLEEQSTRTNAEGQKAGPGHYITMSKDLAGVYGGKGGSLYKVESPFSNAFDFNKVDPSTRQSNESVYNSLVEQTGSRTGANKALKEMGYDAITFTDGRGNKIANLFSEKAVTLEGPARKVETFLGDLELLPKEERPTTPDTPQTPKTPETLAIKQQEQKKLSILAKTAGTKNFPKEWLDVTTLEEAKHLAKTEPDIGGGLINLNARRAAAGIQGQTIVSGNPLHRYIRYVAGNGRALQANLSQRLVTNKQDGLAIKLQDLSGKELTATIEALRQGSQNKFKLTPEVLDQLGFNGKQRSFVEAYYKHSQALLDAQNASRADLGFKPIEAHEGWFTDVWKGQYKTAVMDKDGDVIAFITTDTKLGQQKAREYYSKKHPGATFGSMLYSGLNGKKNVDVFSGLNDVLAIIAKNDPKMAEILAKGQEVQKLANNDLFGVSKHELRKSGKVGGSEGNKPWLSRDQNAKEAARAMIDYFETAIEHTALQKPLAEINKILLDTEINQPNAKESLRRYGEHISGKTGDVGKAIDGIFDLVAAIPVVGFGSRAPINFLGHVKSAMNRKFMGFNLGFLGAQILQPAQTWAPVASMFASKLGLPQHDVMTAFARGSQWALVENLAKWYEQPSLGIAPEYIKIAIAHAEARGIHAFNELELSHRATKTKVARKAGEMADFTVSAGDRMTKLPAFLGLVDMLHIGGGIPLKDSLAIAEKGLESGMTNYHPWERPQMYQRLGVLGQFAGGLTTFKHSQANLYAKTIQEAFGKTKDPRSMLMMTGSMVFFAGITGLMGYAEADQLYSKIMELTTGKPRTIREDLLKNLPDFLKNGVLSAASGLNWQAKVSAADMVPDTLTKAASPHLEAAGKVVGSVAQAVNDPSNVNIKNAVQELMPTGLSKLSERLMNTDEQGQILGKDGLPKYETPDDPVEAAKVEQARKAGSWLGMGTIYDAVQGTDLYKDRQAATVQQEKQKALAIKIKGAITGDEYARALKLAEEYDEVSGVPGSGVKILQDTLKKNTVEKQLSPRHRAQGTPKNLAGVRKWENYNDGE